MTMTFTNIIAALVLFAGFCATVGIIGATVFRDHPANHLCEVCGRRVRTAKLWGKHVCRVCYGEGP